MPEKFSTKKNVSQRTPSSVLITPVKSPVNCNISQLYTSRQWRYCRIASSSALRASKHRRRNIVIAGRRKKSGSKRRKKAAGKEERAIPRKIRGASDVAHFRSKPIISPRLAERENAIGPVFSFSPSSSSSSFAVKLFDRLD